MFIGQYEHQLEAKNRLSIPKKFRSQFANGAILSQGLDGCLFLYPKSVWEGLVNKLSQLPLTRGDARSFIRSLSYGASEVEIDRLGRILIPDYLKNYASIATTCVIAGSLNRVEIWSKDKFDKYLTQISSQSESIAEKLSDMGI